jgi:hypothetical protein
MKEDELREHTVCSKCNKKIGHIGLPLFWTAHIQRYGLKMDAIKRNAGLAAFFNGHAGLARIMGANEDMAESILSHKITLCEDCAMPIMQLLEACNLDEEETDTNKIRRLEE